MIKALSWRFGKYLGRFHMLTVKACSEWCLLDSVVNTFFTVWKFGNTFALTIIFSIKMFNIWCRFMKWNKKLRKCFSFWDNCIWIGSSKSSPSWIRYLPSAVNVLTKAPKILSNDGDFASIWEAFTCWLSKGVLKRRFSESVLNKFFTVCYLGNTLAMTIIFFFNTFKIWCRFQKWKRNWKKFFLFFRWLHLNWEWKILAILNTIFGIIVIVLRNNPKISRSTRGNIFQIKFTENDEKHDKSALM